MIPDLMQLLLAGVEVFRLKLGRHPARPARAKIRPGSFSGGAARWNPARYSSSLRNRRWRIAAARTTYAQFSGDVKPGHRVLLADGPIEWPVLDVQGAEVRTEAISGGPMGEAH